MKKDNPKPLKFVSDEPVIKDELGTHQHIAELLIQIVQSESDNPLVVGVFGKWGSGKSSIAKMYEEMAKEANIRNVYLDSWSIGCAKERFGASFLKILASGLIENKKKREETIKRINLKKRSGKLHMELGNRLQRLYGLLYLFF